MYRIGKVKVQIERLINMDVCANVRENIRVMHVHVQVHVYPDAHVHLVHVQCTCTSYKM